jgi:hypothetical protein
MRRTGGQGRAGDEPIPDFALTVKDQPFAVEVEGTLHRAHINEKHRRHAALARRLGANFQVYLTIVLTFPDDRDHANARHSHELAFTRQERDYHCYIARLPAVLAAKPRTPLWDLEEQLDWREIRERERAHHERMGHPYDGW